MEEQPPPPASPFGDQPPGGSPDTDEPPDAFLTPAGPLGVEFPEWLDFLRNRFIIAGLALLAVLLLTAIVLFALGGTEEEADGPKVVVAQPTEQSEATPVPGQGLPGRLRFPADLRNGPGRGYPKLAALPSGAPVSVVGRNEDNTWLQIIPVLSGVRGWVEADVVEVTGDVTLLAIAGPGSQPSVPVPTRIHVPDEDEDPVVPTPRPQPTSTRPPPTSTAAPPTSTPPPTAPPTATPVPPTATQVR